MAFIYDSTADNLNDQGRASAHMDSVESRVKVRPLPLEVAGPTDLPQGDGDLRRMAPKTLPKREFVAEKLPAPFAQENEVLPAPEQMPHAPDEQPSGMRRAAGALRVALPYVRRILPLLVEGNVAATVAGLLSQHLQPVEPSASFHPIKEDLARLEAQQRELRGRVQQQNSAMERIENELGKAREASERNYREQQELLDEIKRNGNRMRSIAWLGFALLTLSLLTNIALYLHFQRVFP